MARPSDPKKLAVWRERLERFSRSGLTVTRFCGGERVSIASFYLWRKRLGHKGRGRRTNRRGAFQPVAVVPAALRVVSRSPAVCIQLPCGTRIEVGAEALDAVRAVVAEVTRAGRDLESDGGVC